MSHTRSEIKGQGGSGIGHDSPYDHNFRTSLLRGHQPTAVVRSGRGHGRHLSPGHSGEVIYKEDIEKVTIRHSTCIRRRGRKESFKKYMRTGPNMSLSVPVSCVSTYQLCQYMPAVSVPVNYVSTCQCNPAVINSDHAVGIDAHAVGQFWAGNKVAADTVINYRAADVSGPVSTT